MKWLRIIWNALDHPDALVWGFLLSWTGLLAMLIIGSFLAGPQP